MESIETLQTKLKEATQTLADQKRHFVRPGAFWKAFWKIRGK